MKEFTPDKYLGHKINRISRSIDRYFDRKRCSKTECIPRSQGMMIGYIMDNQDQNIFQKDIEAEFHLSGATVTNMLKSLEKNGYIVRTPMENDARLKKIELYVKQFLKFQAILCLTKKFRILRKMNIIQRIGQGHQLMCCD